MKRLIVGGLAALALGGSLLGAGAASADASTINEIAFVQVLDDRGISYSTEDNVIEAGHSACTLLDSGFTPARVTTLTANATSWSLSDSAYFVGASVAAFCPSHERDSFS